MTWSEFNTAVRVHTVAHNRRQGVQSLIDALIKASVWDLQSTVEFFPQRATRKFAPSVLRTDGNSAMGSLTPGSRVLSVYKYDTPDTDNRVTFDIVTDPAVLTAMVTGTIDGGRDFFHYDSKTGIFHVTPKPQDDGGTVVIEFEGKQLDYEDEDDVPFDEKSAEAVAMYVLARVALQVDKDPAGHQVYDALYRQQKRKLHSELNPALLTPSE